MESSNIPFTADTGPGTGIKDLLPIPATDSNDADIGLQAPSGAPGDGPTFSHALATETQDREGRVQQDHEKDVRDLGWNEKKQDIAAPLVGGMANEELWLLVRRFNKQIYDVKATSYPPPGGLDLNTADDQEFSPDKLRANFERLYMTVGVGVLAAVKHIARLRSWRESKRTSYFAAAYFVAWAFDFLVPLLSAVFVALIGFPKTRQVLFPPAPVALVDSSTGGIKKPAAGILGSHDSATGAPENHKGEAVEQEASSFVSGIASVVVSSAAGKHPPGDSDSDGNAATDVAPDPTALAAGVADARDKASNSGRSGTTHDKTKVPMETVIWAKMRPVMEIIGTIADTWERFANALSPIPLFPSEVYRLRLVGILLPLLFGFSLFVTPYILIKSLSFFVGFVFFGDPILTRGIAWLNRTIPNWQKLLQPRNTLLKGVPTNAQLTLTLLRHGEANRAPLPPPPRTTSPPPNQPAPLTSSNLRATGGGDAPLNASLAELDAAIAYDPSAVADHTGDPDIDATKDPHSKHGRAVGKLLGLFKGTARGVVKTAAGTDTLRAKVGSSEPAKNRLGVLPTASSSSGDKGEGVSSGPVEFEARWDGEKGRVVISSSGATVPVVAFARGERAGVVEVGGEKREDLRAVWSVPVADIVEMRKIGGYGWKAKLVVGWSMDGDVKDGLVIRTGEGGEYKITALPLRDELFNRLVAMGGQKWQAW
ncbi:hypothetical protein C8A00DRAFT_41479 [Chaetomidium leptoderma]|uniref:Uncharacterized protein n=1 Tax=Chaetomidium leptoderma TaxID=669021 RepID=A0AAN6VQN1_9PEZI|nr:hypothetical protein C8A00DRAFT_41479 [Chaetomidium leptoderma]